MHKLPSKKTSLVFLNWLIHSAGFGAAKYIRSIGELVDLDWAEAEVGKRINGTLWANKFTFFLTTVEFFLE
jgi:hypothetical protein